MLSANYRGFLQDLFSGLGALEIRPMFGVGGLFCDGTMIAVIANETVFLKTDETSRRDYLREGSKPFVYQVRDGGKIVTSYYALPSRFLDDPEEAVRWGRRAYEIALRSPTALRKERRRTKPRSPRQLARRHTRS